MCDHSKLSCIDQIETNTAKEFIDFLNPTNEVWGDKLKCPWIYRGQRDAEWGLLPRAWRLEERREMGDLLMSLKEIAREKHKESGSILESENMLEAVCIMSAISEMTSKFCELADDLGYPVPGRKEIPKTDLLDCFTWLEQQLTPNFSQPEAFALAQHHGIPTHLLDWTENPFTAAFFAADSYESSRKKIFIDNNTRNPEPEHKTLAVFAINRELIATCTWESNSLTPFTCPRAHHAFLHAQDGLFLWHSRAFSHYMNSGRWPDFLDVIEKGYKESHEKPIKKITLSGTHAKDALELLRRLRITRARLMPTFDNVAKEVWSLNFRHALQLLCK